MPHSEQIIALPADCTGAPHSRHTELPDGTALPHSEQIIALPADCTGAPHSGHTELPDGTALPHSEQNMALLAGQTAAPHSGQKDAPSLRGLPQLAHIFCCIDYDLRFMKLPFFDRYRIWPAIYVIL